MSHLYYLCLFADSGVLYDLPISIMAGVLGEAGTAYNS